MRVSIAVTSRDLFCILSLGIVQKPQKCRDEVPFVFSARFPIAVAAGSPKREGKNDTESTLSYRRWYARNQDPLLPPPGARGFFGSGASKGSFANGSMNCSAIVKSLSRALQLEVKTKRQRIASGNLVAENRDLQDVAPSIGGAML